MTDISMPVMNGIDAVQKIKQEYPALLCIMLTNFDSDHLIMNALEAGAFSYVNKAMPKETIFLAKETIFLAIERTLDEKPYHCPSTSQRVLRMIANSDFSKAGVRTELFNESEKKIIALFCKDMLVKEIAAAIHLGDRTVERYKARIMEKMGCKTTAGIVMYAIRNKLVIPDDSGI